MSVGKFDEAKKALEKIASMNGKKDVDVENLLDTVSCLLSSKERYDLTQSEGNRLFLFYDFIDMPVADDSARLNCGSGRGSSQCDRPFSYSESAYEDHSCHIYMVGTFSLVNKVMREERIIYFWRSKASFLSLCSTLTFSNFSN